CPYVSNHGRGDKKGRMERIRLYSIQDATKAMADRGIKVNQKESDKERKETGSATLTKGFFRKWGRLLCVCTKTKGENKGSTAIHWPLYASTSDWNQSD